MVLLLIFLLNLRMKINTIYKVNLNMAGDADSKAMQGIANDRPEIAQRIFKNREKSIGATGLEPAT